MSHHDDGYGAARDMINFVAGSMLGAAVGVGIALLFAPKTGLETRRILKKEGKKVIKTLGDSMQELDRASIQPTIEKVKKEVGGHVDRMKDEVKQVVSDVKSQLKSDVQKIEKEVSKAAKK